MNRRAFLTRAGLVTGGAVAGVTSTAGVDLHHERTDVAASGHAVGQQRPVGLTGTSITYRVRTTRPFVALTFDDGPSAEYTERVLDILDRKQVSATFNLIGAHAQKFPELARRAAAGHEIGNHTWSHPNMSLFDAADARDELHRGAEAITQASGVRPRTWRPPYGYFSGATIMMAASLGYPIVLWDNRFDRHGASVESNVSRLTTDVGPGSIILGHDGGPLHCDVVVAALPTLIDALLDKGLTFVTTSALLAMDTPTVAATAAH